MYEALVKPLLGRAALCAVIIASSLPGYEPAVHSYYVAPNGTSAGDGTMRQPWDLRTALTGAGGRVQPGDTVWVRGGTYRGSFESRLRGAMDAPVVVRNYHGERAIIDHAGSTTSALYVTGDYGVYWGLELTNSNPTRNFAMINHDARPDVVVNRASHTKYINLVIHDGGTGFYTYPDFVDLEVAGCIVYNNGWNGPDFGHGHGLYLKSFTGPLLVRDNVVFDQYGYGIHAYTNANTGKLINIRIEGNVSFNNGSPSRAHANPNILLGGAAHATGDVVADNLTYSPLDARSANVRIGFKQFLNGDVQVVGNYFAGGDPVLDFGYWQAAVIADNTIIGGGTLVRRNQNSASHVFRNNAEERGTTETKTVVRPNPYEPGRALIVVFNWGRRSSVTINLSKLFHPGDRYEVRKVDDLFGEPVRRGTAKSAVVSLPLSGEFATFLVTAEPQR